MLKITAATNAVGGLGAALLGSGLFVVIVALTRNGIVVTSIASGLDSGPSRRSRGARPNQVEADATDR